MVLILVEFQILSLKVSQGIQEKEEPQEGPLDQGFQEVPWKGAHYGQWQILWICIIVVCLCRTQRLSLKVARVYQSNITESSGRKQVGNVPGGQLLSPVAHSEMWYILNFFCTVEGIKRVEEIKQKRQSQFIKNRSVWKGDV